MPQQGCGTPDTSKTTHEGTYWQVTAAMPLLEMSDALARLQLPACLQQVAATAAAAAEDARGNPRMHLQACNAEHALDAWDILTIT
jgi:hypothetical protein